MIKVLKSGHSLDTKERYIDVMLAILREEHGMRSGLQDDRSGYVYGCWNDVSKFRDMFDTSGVRLRCKNIDDLVRGLLSAEKGKTSRTEEEIGNLQLEGEILKLSRIISASVYSAKRQVTSA